MERCKIFQGNSEGIIPVRAWTWNGENTQRPYQDEYNESHIYYYYFVGDGTSEQFGFEDGGGYGDNSGSNLNIEIYEMENQSESNYSLSFDGVDDYVEIPKSGTLNLDGSSNFTIQLHIYNTMFSIQETLHGVSCLVTQVQQLLWSW